MITGREFSKDVVLLPSIVIVMAVAIVLKSIAVKLCCGVENVIAASQGPS